MESLEIKTSHNIIVTVEYASVSQRMVATFIDLMIIAIVAGLLTTIIRGNTILMYLIIFPLVTFYHLICEILNNGQSIGKKALKLKVISLSGDKPTLNDYIMRWMFRLVDITFSLGMLAIVFVTSTKNKQRTGDILGNTTVVKLNNETNMDLKAIKSIAISEDKIKYPKVTMYNDTDMLLIKQTLSRSKKNHSMETRAMINDIAQKIAKDIKIKNVPKNKDKFLQDILEEYIVLTR